MPTKSKSTRKTKKKEERVILFPTEPSVIGREKIREAVRAAIAERLEREKAAAGKG